MISRALECALPQTAGMIPTAANNTAKLSINNFFMNKPPRINVLPAATGSVFIQNSFA